MSSILKLNIPNNSLFGYTASTVFHAVILFVVIVLLNLSDNRARMNPRFVQVTTGDINNPVNTGKPIQQQKTTAPQKEIVNDKKPAKEEPDNTGNKALQGAFYNLSDAAADTTGLDQVYNEPTLNVTVKYPAGWTYLDQNVNRKLDGVTFWSTIGNFTPPPYINLEVKDKDLFDARKYKYNIKTWGFTIYYNDPEEMENQVSQIFYIRTNAGEDFSMKLIMNGKEEFKAFQPVFFGMIKSFKFGKGLF